MEGKVFGIPLVLILLVLFIAALVDIPLYTMYRAQTKTNQRLELMVNEINGKMTLKITPIVTPAPEVSPAVKKIVPTVKPTVSSQSSQLR